MSMATARARSLLPVWVLVGGGLLGCPPAADTQEDDDARVVEVARVATSDAVRTTTAVGTLEGQRQVQVFTMMPERVISLRVKEGDHVEKGKTLAVLSADVQDEAVRQAEATLAAVEAARDALAADVERTRKLVAAQAAPKSQLESLENQFLAQEAQVRQTAAGVAAASVQRRRAVISAPISGRATQIGVREGDMATPQMPLLSIVEGRRVKAVFRLPERAFLEVREGMPITVGLLGDHAVEVSATVTLRGATIDSRSRTGLVEVELDNSDGRLVPGAAVRARIEIERRPGIVLVPAQAILLTPTTDLDRRAIAFVAKGERAERREVTIGVHQGGQIEVVKGLETGEWLVVRGQHLLRDGEKIAPSESADATPTPAAPEVAPPVPEVGAPVPEAAPPAPEAAPPAPGGAR